MSGLTPDGEARRTALELQMLVSPELPNDPFEVFWTLSLASRWKLTPEIVAKNIS